MADGNLESSPEEIFTMPEDNGVTVTEDGSILLYKGEHYTRTSDIGEIGVVDTESYIHQLALQHAVEARIPSAGPEEIIRNAEVFEKYLTGKKDEPAAPSS